MTVRNKILLQNTSGDKINMIYNSITPNFY